MTLRHRLTGSVVHLTLPADLDLAGIPPTTRALTRSIQLHGLTIDHPPAWARRRRLRALWRRHIRPRLLP